MKKILLMLPILMICGCSKKNNPASDNASDSQPYTAAMVPVSQIESRPLAAVLKATAFKMTGDYSKNVAITLNPDGSLAYYPAPSDISKNSAPVDLGNGWWLNRQGLSPNSVFTRFTFEEYAKLPSVPSPDELKASIIPGARVSDWKQLSYPASSAMDNLPHIKEEIKD